MADSILIEALELSSCIGVPDEERVVAQRLKVNLVLEPLHDFRGLGDSLAGTVDYFAVCTFVKSFSRARPRCLIETLAEEIAGELLARFAVRAVEVELHKYILPDTAFVGVRLRRERVT